MKTFENVAVNRLANVYFDGKVTSRTVFFADGTRKTLGIMLPGEYTFDTNVAERMEIQAGRMKVRLPGSSDWQTFSDGQSFDVPADAEFDLQVESITDYCCSYLG